MIFSLFDHPDGLVPVPGNRVVFDVGRGEAWFGDIGAEEHVLVWELSEFRAEGAKLSVEVELDPNTDWLMRCDRVEFPPGGVAHRHVHPGPGIRYLLYGSIRIDGPDGLSETFGPGEPWFEAADHPVLATASPDVETAFVRVLLLPREWEGKRTIRYLDPADEEKPKLQRAKVYLEHPVDL